MDNKTVVSDPNVLPAAMQLTWCVCGQEGVAGKGTAVGGREEGSTLVGLERSALRNLGEMCWRHKGPLLT